MFAGDAHEDVNAELEIQIAESLSLMLFCVESNTAQSSPTSQTVRRSISEESSRKMAKTHSVLTLQDWR